MGLVSLLQTGWAVKHHPDKQRLKDEAGMREIRDQKLAARKRTALRVLDAGGPWSDAATAAQASPETVKKWAAEVNHPRAAERRKT
jgi:hypothetical protein